MKCDYCDEYADLEIHISDVHRFYNNLFVCSTCYDPEDASNYNVSILTEA